MVAVPAAHQPFSVGFGPGSGTGVPRAARLAARGGPSEGRRLVDRRAAAEPRQRDRGAARAAGPRGGRGGCERGGGGDRALAALQRQQREPTGALLPVHPRSIRPNQLSSPHSTATLRNGAGAAGHGVARRRRRLHPTAKIRRCADAAGLQRVALPSALPRGFSAASAFLAANRLFGYGGLHGRAGRIRNLPIFGPCSAVLSEVRWGGDPRRRIARVERRGGDADICALRCRAGEPRPHPPGTARACLQCSRGHGLSASGRCYSSVVLPAGGDDQAVACSVGADQQGWWEWWRRRCPRESTCDAARSCGRHVGSTT